MLPSIRSLQLCNSRPALRFPSGCLSSCYNAIATPRILFAPRRYAAAAAGSVATEDLETKALPPTPSPGRFNELGVQQLSSHVYSQIFKVESTPPPPELVKLSRDHLSRHELLGKISEHPPPIEFDLPELQGSTLDEHFYKLGTEVSEPYLTIAKRFAQDELPPKPEPEKWKLQAGWTMYLAEEEAQQVDHPDEEAMVFDVEVLYKVSPFAVLACAASSKAWYAWISPWLLGENENDRQLIPFGDIKTPRVTVGHNIGYDRARIKQEYNLVQSKNFFMDTMSLHVAVNGMCSRQRPTWVKHKKNKELKERIRAQTRGSDLSAVLTSMPDEDAEELWVERSAVNSLRDVAKFHCGIDLDKEVRDQFGGVDKEAILENLMDLLDYCAKDVATTHKVYQKVLPEFLRVCPHPVSFGALRHLSSVILPVNRKWENYIETAERKYQELSEGVKARLIGLTNAALQIKPCDYEEDEWLRQLDWSGQEIRYLKLKKGETEPRLARQKLPGKPKWYKALFPKSLGPISLSVRTRIAPLLLKLSWDGHPLIWSDKFGWTYRVSPEEAKKYEGTPAIKCDMSAEKNLALRDDTENIYFKLPHKNGPKARCVSPLAKGYLKYFEDGTLTSEFPLAREALEMNAACSYWISARERIRSQMVVWLEEIGEGTDCQWEGTGGELADIGVILPQLIPMGTITRRAVERTWLTASNAKKNRLGSELKAKVVAPPGYSFVGADVDSQELWIASLIGDAQFKVHGGNALGFMTLEGTRANETDLHSKTANILGISRNHAKVFNYGRIYGAGVSFASTLLRQFNPTITDDQCSKIAQDLYRKTKGQPTLSKQLSKRKFWRGGTESFVFNKLEEFADQDRPRTPVLGAGITEALMRKHLSRNGFLPSRINWAIQSSGVDYLHLLVVSMDYLIRKYQLQARLAITVHDEIRYLVKNEDKYRAAMALQVANVWTRSMFSQQMGINDLPQSCAYFSAVDIDHVLRKEVDMDCVTPTNPDKIPPGESLDIVQLLKEKSAALDPDRAIEIAFKDIKYEPRTPIMEDLQEETNLFFLKAQITDSPAELREVVKELASARKPAKKSTRLPAPMPQVEKNIVLDNNLGDPFMLWGLSPGRGTTAPSTYSPPHKPNQPKSPERKNYNIA